MGLKVVASLFLFVAVTLATDKCRDEYPRSKCAVWKARGYCKQGHRFYDFMLMNCKKECRICKVKKVTVKDTDKNCPGWKSYCKSNNYVKKHCKKTCGGKTEEKKIKPVHGQWGAWSEFEKCTVSSVFTQGDKKCVKTSASQRVTRTRKCDSPSPKHGGRKCIGKDTDDASCHECTRCNSANYHSNCAGWKMYCADTGYADFMAQHCRITCEGECEKTQPKPKQPTKKEWNYLSGECGLNKIIGGRVVGGEDTKRGEFPWQVGMWKKGGDGWEDEFFCGGTLVDNGDEDKTSSDIFITASHCVEGQWEEDLKVKLGDWDRKEKSRSVVESEIDKIVMHEQYNTNTINNDIAIVKLMKKIKYTRYIQPACLPSTTEDLKTSDGKECTITGWGKTSGGYDGKTSDKLQKAVMPIIARKKCEDMNNRNSPISIDSDTMMCAGPGPDSEVSGCQGDSGGPLVCPVKKGSEILKWVLQGAVSWGDRECRATEKYTVFARITHFLPWIEKTIKKLK